MSVVVSPHAKLAELLDGIVEEHEQLANDLLVLLWKGGFEITVRPPTIETSVWADDPDRPGYMLKVRTKTVHEVFEELVAIVGELGDGHNEYLSMMHPATMQWPDGRITVFSVNGSSEGDYVHVEVHDGDNRSLVFLAKTFDGRDASWSFARRVADILGA